MPSAELCRTFLAPCLLLCMACVPKSTYDAVENERDRLQQELGTVKTEFNTELQRVRTENSALRAELDTRQMQTMGSLLTQLSECKRGINEARRSGERLAKKSEEAGYYRGAAEFNQSLQIAGVPRSDGWWIFASHYYSFQVRLKGQPLYTMTVETQHEMPPALQGLAMVGELAKTLPFHPEL